MRREEESVLGVVVDSAVTEESLRREGETGEEGGVGVEREGTAREEEEEEEDFCGRGAVDAHESVAM